MGQKHEASCLKESRQGHGERHGHCIQEEGQGRSSYCTEYREEQKQILDMCHSESTSGHFGVKTFNRVRERIYLKGMFKDAEDLVRFNAF